MSEQQTDRDMDQALAGWMNRTAPSRAPARLMEATFLETMRTRQVRVYPWHAVDLGLLRRTTGGSAGRRLALVALAALLLAAMTLAFFGVGAPHPTPANPTPGPTATAAPSIAATLPAPIVVAPEAAVPLQAPLAMVLRGTDLWVLAPGRLDRIDPASNTVTGSVPLGSTSDLFNGLAADATGLWATDSTTALLYRVDPATLEVAGTTSAGLSPKGVIGAAGSIWVADVHGGTVLRIDPATNEVASTVTVGPAANSGPNWLAFGLGSVWVDIPNAGTIVRIDPATEAQTVIQAPGDVQACGGLVVGANAAWVTGCSGTTKIARIDPTSNTVVTTVDMGGYGYNPTLINGAPWVSVDAGSAESGMLVRIDTATNTIDRVLVPSGTFGGGGDIVVGDGSVWVVDGYNNTVLRLPLTAFAP